MADTGTQPKAIPVILLIEDEPLLLELLGAEVALTCKLYTAASAAEADLRLAARHYDVIVCDHMLPGEQGLDFLMRAMDMLPSTRRILMTGYTNPEFISRSMTLAGLSACLVKPIRAAELTAAIRSALAS
jgi:CheY-like chemotaxis protein